MSICYIKKDTKKKKTTKNPTTFNKHHAAVLPEFLNYHTETVSETKNS